MYVLGIMHTIAVILEMCMYLETMHTIALFT